MSNLISCHKYFFLKKGFRNICQFKLSAYPSNTSSLWQWEARTAAPSAQHQQVMGIPAVLCFVLSVREPFPWGFSWVAGAEVWVVAQWVCTAWRGGMFTKGWLQSCLREEVSVPRSTPALENRLLVQVGILVGASSLDWRLPDPLLCILMRRHWLITGSSCCPSLQGATPCVPVGSGSE